MLHGHELFQTALRLIGWRPNPMPLGPLAPYDGMPAAPEADLRRSISTSYYALFHRILQVMTDFLVGEDMQGSDEYVKLYRSFSHTALAKSCKTINTRQTGGNRDDIRTIAAVFVDAQNRRHDADYDPEKFFDYKTARLQIQGVNLALSRLAHIRTADACELAVGSLTALRKS